MAPRCLVFASLALAAGCGDSMPNWTPGTGPLAHVTGHAFIFGPNDLNLTLEGATVADAEAPQYSTTVAADGTFELDVPSGAPASFSLVKDGFHPNQSAAIDIGPDGIAMLGFQTPTDGAFDELAQFARVVPVPDDCQISTTVSRAGTEPYGGDGLGEPDAVASIEPGLAATSGPIYFNYLSGTIFPDRALTMTSLDGGVIYANVPVGEYTMTATKDGITFSSVKIRCRAGVLVNAAPPNGIQEL
jgi:hypothetical protein